MTRGIFLSRLTRNERGSHTTELALAVALFALIAGFGFFALGDALADFFTAVGDKIRGGLGFFPPPPEPPPP
jgi:Flp pilus assembly pilin Flp